MTNLAAVVRMREQEIILGFALCRRNMFRSLFHFLRTALLKIVSTFSLLVVITRRDVKGHDMNVSTTSGGFRDIARFQCEGFMLGRMQNVVSSHVFRLLA